MRVWLKRLGFVLLIVLLFFIAAGFYLYSRSHTQESGTIHLRGLKGDVTITRDQYGVPHIVAAKSDLDAFYALGYVHAQDRFWQMEFQRHVVQGTLSELFGTATIEKDEYLRTWGFYRAARTSWESLSPESKAIIQSYSDGVNAFLSQKKYPLQMILLNDQPKPWTNIDSIAWQKMLAWDLQNQWKSKLKNYLVEQKLGKSQIPILFPSYPKDGTTILSDEDLKQSGIYSANVLTSFLNIENPHDKGSNNWVVSGKWTTSGYPMLANDPHLGLQAPALWYLADIKGPTIHVVGATLPGVPGVVIGHNDHIAWGVTNVNPDTQDLYILNADSPVHVINEIIHVRGKPDVNYQVKVSDEGPIISQVTDAGKINQLVALKWSALMPDDTTVQSMLEINYANNWDEFTKALKDFVVPSQNFIYADTQGNIGYYVPGRIPIRHWDSSFPVPDDSAHQWDGYIPFDKMPHVYNPPEGYIVSANNRVVSDHYPYYLTFRWNDPDYRAKRIVELLTANRPLDNSKFEKIQLDTVSLLWKDISPILLKTQPLDDQSKKALDLLKNWNGDASLDSTQKTIFAYWYRELEKMTPDFLAPLAKFPQPLFIQQQLESNGQYCQNCSDFMSKSLQTAMQKLTYDLGNDPEHWQWRKVHRAVFPELGLGTIPVLDNIWNRSISTPGGLFTVNVGTYDMQNFTQTDGASYREIIDLNNFNQSEFIQTLGQSDNIFSSHYDDYLRPWRDGKYVPMTSEPKGDVKVLTLLPE
ncbi:MAG TPA: penicillin acylase family protein [Gammaproteobacteria bacterium]|nr:penicillin acylase family protein [Gammaproteobacteria bacterium]